LSYTTEEYTNRADLQAGLDSAHDAGLVVVSHAVYTYQDPQTHQHNTLTSVIYSDVATDIIQGGEKLSSMADDILALRNAYAGYGQELAAALTAVANASVPAAAAIPVTPAAVFVAPPTSGIADADKLAAAANPAAGQAS
jgi:hypothetical protein